MSITGSLIFVFLVLFLFISESESAAKFELPSQDLSLIVNIKRRTKNKPECTEKYLRSLPCRELIYLTKQVNYIYRKLLCLLRYVAVYGYSSNVDLRRFEALIKSEVDSLSLEKHFLGIVISEKSCVEYSTDEIDLTPLKPVETCHLGKYEIPLVPGQYCRSHVRITLFLLNRKHEKLEKISVRSRSMEIKGLCLYTYFKNLTSLTSLSMSVIADVLKTLYDLYPKEGKSKSYEKFLLSQGNYDTSSSSSDEELIRRRTSSSSSEGTSKSSDERKRESVKSGKQTSTKLTKDNLFGKQSAIRKILSGFHVNSRSYTVNPYKERHSPNIRANTHRSLIPTPGFSATEKPLNTKEVKQQSEMLIKLQDLPLQQAILELNISDYPKDLYQRDKGRHAHTQHQTERNSHHRTRHHRARHHQQSREPQVELEQEGSQRERKVRSREFQLQRREDSAPNVESIGEREKRTRIPESRQLELRTQTSEDSELLSVRPKEGYEQRVFLKTSSRNEESPDRYDLDDILRG